MLAFYNVRPDVTAVPFTLDKRRGFDVGSIFGPTATHLTSFAASGISPSEEPYYL
jgi:hypothetical protein